MADVSIEVSRLTRRFGTRTAVDGLTFTARLGDVVGLLGPNGAGKTTAIRRLHRCAHPQRGPHRRAGPGERGQPGIV